jgi:ABC-type glutathione transport system ATPase component
MRMTQPQPAEAALALPRPEPLIRVEGVGRRYRVGDHEVVALADVSFEVRAEEFIVVLGPSGCGKTTLLNMIGALDSPTEGRVVVAGRDITRASRKELFGFRRHGVSFVFQTFNLFPALTALENAEFGADVAGRPDPTAVAAEMLERVGLGDRLRHFPHGCRAASSSVSRSRGRWRPATRRCWLTSPPASWTSAPASRSSSCCTLRRTPAARWSWSRTTARSRALPTA